MSRSRPLPAAPLRRTLALSVGDGVFFAFMVGVGENFLVADAMRLGASTVQLRLVGSATWSRAACAGASTTNRTLLLRVIGLRHAGGLAHRPVESDEKRPDRSQSNFLTIRTAARARPARRRIVKKLL